MQQYSIVSKEEQSIVTQDSRVTGRFLWTLVIGSITVLIVLKSIARATIPMHNPLADGSSNYPPSLRESAKTIDTAYSDGVKRRITEYLNTNDAVANSTIRADALLHMFAKYRVAPEYGLTACEIKKNLETALESIMCYLYDTEGFEAVGRDINKELSEHRTCFLRNEIFSTLDLHKLLPSRFSTIFVVRDPVDRFLDAYIDKCKNEQPLLKSNCYGCAGNLGCVVDEVYKRMLGTSNGSISMESVVDLEMRHFAPQSWFCDLADNYQSFEIVKYGSQGVEKQRMIDTTLDILERHKVPKDKLNRVRDMLNVKPRWIHAANGSPYRGDYRIRLRSNKTMMDRLRAVYKTDYELFGFDLPVDAQ